MQHRKFGYAGVITGWNHRCMQSEEWILAMGVDKLPGMHSLCSLDWSSDASLTTLMYKAWKIHEFFMRKHDLHATIAAHCSMYGVACEMNTEGHLACT